MESAPHATALAEAVPPGEAGGPAAFRGCRLPLARRDGWLAHGVIPRISRFCRVACLVAAWFCASGALLDCAQLFAWSRMFVGYARTLSLPQAVAETMDPGKPCRICRAIQRARNASRQQAPAPSAAAPKLVLSCERSDVLVFPPDFAGWPESPSPAPAGWQADVEVPPPRT